LKSHGEDVVEDELAIPNDALNNDGGNGEDAATSAGIGGAEDAGVAHGNGNGASLANDFRAAETGNVAKALPSTGASADSTPIVAVANGATNIISKANIASGLDAIMQATIVANGIDPGFSSTVGLKSRTATSAEDEDDASAAAAAGNDANTSSPTAPKSTGTPAVADGNTGAVDSGTEAQVDDHEGGNGAPSDGAAAAADDTSGIPTIESPTAGINAVEAHGNGAS